MTNPTSRYLYEFNGSNGFLILARSPDEQFGFSVSEAGDINGDGIDDLIIGSRYADVNDKKDAGRSYVVFGGTGIGAGNNFELSSLNGSNGFVINGINANDRVGQSVSRAGDFNGDGIGDLIVGSFNSSGGSVGRSYVIFGKKGGFAPSFDLNEITTGSGYQKGFSIGGAGSEDLVGFSVSAAGDIDKDGYGDLIIGAPGPKTGTDFGRSYILYGQKLDSEYSVYHLRTTIINGITKGDRLGDTVSDAGDVNGDGYADLILGARAANGAAGEAYVVFGNASIIPGSGFDYARSLDLANLNGSNGFKIPGTVANDLLGWSVSKAGDINHDGFGDLIIGAPGRKPSDTTPPSTPGKSYVVFGKSGGFDPTLNVSSLNGTNGFVINGLNPGDGLGFSVSDAGDLNADGFDDLVIGAPYADAGSLFGDAGEIYVIYGSTGVGAGGSFDLGSLNGTNGFILKGTFSNDNSGWSVSKAGDVNHDGFGDLIIGALEPGTAGKSYIVFGGATGSQTVYYNVAKSVSDTGNIFNTENITATDFGSQGVFETLI